MAFSFLGMPLFVLGLCLLSTLRLEETTQSAGLRAPETAASEPSVIPQPPQAAPESEKPSSEKSPQS